jgi:putative tryptophan/tyrosine transport system substrate-binding protein
MKPLAPGRRSFLARFGSIAIVWPFTAQAATTKVPVRIGFVPLGSPESAYDQSLVAAFQHGLERVGLKEARDVVLDTVWVTEGADKAVADVLSRGAGLLVTCGTSASVAAQRQTWSIPIVFISVGNPVGIGIADSVSRPARNATGFSDILSTLGGKLVEFAQELNKPQTAVDYLWHTDWPDGEARFRSTSEAARTAGIEFRSQGIRNAGEIADAVAKLKNSGATTLIVQPSPFSYRERGRIIDSAAKQGLGTIFAFPVAAREGALMGYGPDYLHMYDRAAFYIDRILRGAQPGDLPIDEAAKLQLVVNLKTANAIGRDVPLRLLVGADELIE